jgi:hypothetical protein
MSGDLDSEILDAPHGYNFGNVSGHSRRHLVKAEPWNVTAVCGVTCTGALSSVRHVTAKLCRDCKAEMPDGR